MKPRMGKYYLFKTKTTYSSYPKIAYGKRIQLSTDYLVKSVAKADYNDNSHKTKTKKFIYEKIKNSSNILRRMKNE